MTRTKAALPFDSAQSNMAEACSPPLQAVHITPVPGMQWVYVVPLSSLQHAAHKPSLNVPYSDLLKESEPAPKEAVQPSFPRLSREDLSERSCGKPANRARSCIKLCFFVCVSRIPFQALSGF